MTKHTIVCIPKPYFYWSNEFGWGHYRDATIFTEDETKSLHLPLEGRWQKVNTKEEENA